jgi:hypothetical protein
MKEPQARGKKRQNGGRLVNLWRKCRCGTRLVVIFKKPGELFLVLEPSDEVLTDGSCVAFS